MNMKNLSIAVILAAVLVVGFSTGVFAQVDNQPAFGWHAPTSANQRGGAPAVFPGDNGTMIDCVYVQNQSGTTIVRGNPVCSAFDSAPAAVSATAVDKIMYTIVAPDSSSTYNYAYFLGIAVDTIEDGEYGWVQVRGVCEAYTDTVVAGSLLKLYSAYAGSTTYDYLTTAATKTTLAGASGAASITQYAMGPKVFCIVSENQPTGRGLSWVILQ